MTDITQTRIIDEMFYARLCQIGIEYPDHYAMSDLPRVVPQNMKSETRSFSIVTPVLGNGKKKDNGNANVTDGFIEFQLKELTTPLEKFENYRLLYTKIWELYGEELANVFLFDDIVGRIYTHNSQNIATKPYCFAYDFDVLVEKGAFFTEVADRPAQHLDSFIQHVIEFVAVTCRETTGAVGLPALFPYMWYYWAKDVASGYCSNPKVYLRQQIQMLVYKLNGSEMRTNESAFTNVSVMDESYLEHFFGDREFPDGSPVVMRIPYILELELFFLECVNEILSNKVMTFPVITMCLLYDDKEQKFVNEETAKKFVELNRVWSNSNFYCGTDISTLSSCCRVLNNIEVMNTKLRGFSNFIGGSDLNIGSVGVVSLNLPHIAYTLRSVLQDYRDETLFFSALRFTTLQSCKYLHAIRACIQDLIDENRLKVYHYGLIKMERQFNTIGFMGLYDSALIMDFVEDSEVLEFEKRVLVCIKEAVESFSSDKAYSINVEQVPGESAAIKLAKKDQMTFSHAAGRIPRIPNYYSNQWIPLTVHRSINDRVIFAAELDKLCDGGSILHLNIDAPFANSDQMLDMLNSIAERGVIYFAFNNKISVDIHEHGFYGDVCWCGEPKVGEATRPVGFITLVKDWIPSRQEEYRDREWYTI